MTDQQCSDCWATYLLLVMRYPLLTIERCLLLQLEACMHVCDLVRQLWLYNWLNGYVLVNESWVSVLVLDQ